MVKKWQDRWEIAESGRHLFQVRPEVNYKQEYKFDSKALKHSRPAQNGILVFQ